jgi:hypothetical protein
MLRGWGCYLRKEQKELFVSLLGAKEPLSRGGCQEGEGEKQNRGTRSL